MSVRIFSLAGAAMALAGCVPPPPPYVGLKLTCVTGLDSYADAVRVRSTPDGNTLLLAYPEHSLQLQTNTTADLQLTRGQECVIAPTLHSGRMP